MTMTRATLQLVIVNGPVSLLLELLGDTRMLWGFIEKARLFARLKNRIVARLAKMIC